MHQMNALCVLKKSTITVIFGLFFLIISSCGGSGGSTVSGSSTSTAQETESHATFLVSQTGTRTSGASILNDWSDNNCYSNIEDAIREMSGGDTVIVDDGTYFLTEKNFISSLKTEPPNGTADRPTTIRARHPLEVRIESHGDLSYYDYFVHLDEDRQYINVDGFVYVCTDPTPVGMFNLAGSYSKVTNAIAIRKGAMDNYASAFSVTGHHNLVEDSAATGHTRYLFVTGGTTSTAHHNIFRRCVGRTDYSDSNQPMAAFSFYGNNSGHNTHSMLFQNCIAIDGHQMANGAGSYSYAWGGFYFPKNAYNTRIQGSIVLNQDSRYGAFAPIELQGGELVIENSIAWDNSNSNGGASEGFNFRGSGNGIKLDHCTSGANNSMMEMVNAGSADQRFLSNSLFYDNADQGEIGQWLGANEYNAFYPAGQAFGDHSLISDEIKYIVRVEENASISKAGNDGKDIGARVIKRYGRDGSLWGEPGFDKLQDGTDGQEDNHLWPFPNEDKIKALFSEQNDPNPGSVPNINDTTRGFCATGKQLNGRDDITLTSYIWEYLGHPIPDDIYEN